MARFASFFTLFTAVIGASALPLHRRCSASSSSATSTATGTSVSPAVGAASGLPIPTSVGISVSIGLPTGTPTGSSSSGAPTGTGVPTGSSTAIPTGTGSSSGTPTSSGSAAPTSTGSSGSGSGPHWVVYSDAWISGETGPPKASDLDGFNAFLLSFWMTTGPSDQATTWSQLDATTRQSTKAEYKAAGIKLMVSAFGSTEQPTTGGADPVATADNLATFVTQNDLDGVDIDYEDFQAINLKDGSAENWLIKFTTELRKKLPAGQYTFTHAPVAPWFSGAPTYPSGAYLAVDKAVGSMIDWYNVQFYNQNSDYESCDGLLTKSSSTFPNSSVFEIAKSGVPLDKIVIGKPATQADQTNGGFMSTSALASCIATAKGKGWNAGVMSWEYPQADSAWIKAVQGSAFAA
ncbi:glycoside hydrolase family 18 protein [Coniophora puteana RWD-64-598 SS2]|uniref:Glycoside hydrolase family 18 protein n=1 Tax=Coniophora puteana (strain RWD-64-598) TaxID=741705 RepID=A0A5M3MH94_CONPW|nr:glycoside hydrolase family 18 protein [Coniophora puteana RWD-64-598 SS2]EIW77991.1 glycoside hydrolase family 18 protein [Coniophora puteana RWD-64-598 SS2]